MSAPVGNDWPHSSFRHFVWERQYFVVAYLVGGSILSRRFAADGTPLDAGSVTVATATSTATTAASITSASVAINRSSGDYTIAWPSTDSRIGFAGYHTTSVAHARRYKATGAPKGLVMTLDSCSGAISMVTSALTSGCQTTNGPIAISDSAGNLMFTWVTHYPPSSTTPTITYARQYSLSGAVKAKKFTVATNGGDLLQAAEDGAGNFIIELDEKTARAVYGQRSSE